MGTSAVASLFSCPPFIPNKIYTLNPTTNICFPLNTTTPPFQLSLCAKLIIPVQAVSPVQVPSSEYKEFSVSSQKEGNKLKICVEVFGARTQEIFDDVFSKMVAAAQPIPGFRRVKGGKTPDIPRDILLEVLGPSKVYKEVIKKVIDSAISEYVKKERLTVGKNVSVEQSFEDLEAIFEPGDSFQFDVIVQCQQSN
ncbi:Trigger factor [Heracleum sosnowskyi]|uniref:peptidylprolyl isomerase n=1 Tax=Heracleum sosnowskyi TaxID=360622 RepID=A0AAD8GVY0_9APIA|nr:Trigger factor [Heracleum sosnowskyi]